MAWLPGYGYRKPLVITGGASGAQTYFQLDIDIAHVAAKMQAAFGDIRFTQNNGTTLIDAWLESKVDSASAKTVVEFLTTPANTVESDPWYMYYGNAGVASDWDIGATFAFGDDFEYDDNPTGHGWSLVSGVYNTNYVTSTDYAKRGTRSLKLYPASGQIIELCITLPASNKYAFEVDYYETDATETSLHTYLQSRTVDERLGAYANTSFMNLYSGGWHDTGIARSNGWHKLGILRDGTNVNFKVDDAAAGNYANSGTITSPGLLSGAAVAGWQSTRYYDSFRVRKYAANPPTYAFGAEESAPTGAAPTSVFIGPFGGPFGGPIQ